MAVFFNMQINIKVWKMLYYLEFSWFIQNYIVIATFIVNIAYAVIDMKVHGYEKTKIILKYETNLFGDYAPSQPGSRTSSFMGLIN